MPQTPATTAGAGQPGWVIDWQREATRMQPGAGLIEGVQIGFTTADGVAQSIFVPRPQYTPERVRDLINAAVANITAIHKLQG